VLGFESAEKGLLGAQDLHCRCRVLRQVEQRASVRDQPRSNKLTHQDGEVGRNCGHAILQVIEELYPVFGQRYHLLGQLADVVNIFLANFGSHRNNRRLLHHVL